jgi:autotransporter translocation and assembly factor TamB
MTETADGHLKAQGTFAEPIAEGTLQCENLRAGEENLGTFAAEFRLLGTRLTVESLRLEKPQDTGSGTLEASGSLDWKADTMRFRATGTEIRLDSMALPDGMKIRGVVLLDAEGETSLSAPAWTARVGAAEVSIAGRKITSPSENWR